MILKLATRFIKMAFLTTMAVSCGSASNIKKKTMLINETEREYLVYFSNKNGDSKSVKTVIFLHGLLNASETSRQFLQLVQSVKHLDSVMVVFPIGLKRAFASHPDMLGWTPGYAKDNVLFLERLITQLEVDYGIDKETIIGGGFSNGAYFLSQILQDKESHLFLGFWLQGGGNPQPLSEYLIRKKVFLEVGKLDTGNIGSVRDLKLHLLQNGWCEGDNFFYTELEGGHQLYLNNTEKVLRKLLGS